MRTTRAALAITAVALIGLVVSVIAAWSQLAPGEPLRERLEPPATMLGQPTPEPWSSGEGDRRNEVGRSNAVPTLQGKVAPDRPVRITMSTARIDARVRPVGVAADGQMYLPPNPRVLGWYRFGPTPDGATEGAAVVAGHLDSRRFGLGPLVQLRDVEAGDPVAVTLSDGTRVTYRVIALTRFDQQALPDELFVRTGAPHLHIITCGGAYDVDAGGYQQNLVVTAVPA